MRYITEAMCTQVPVRCLRYWALGGSLLCLWILLEVHFSTGLFAADAFANEIQ
jgi:hypothetical protein